MGWVWSDEADDGHGGAVKSDNNADPRSSDRCSTRKIVKSQCRTEEVEPGKFVRKCEKSEEILRDCLGRPSEVVQSNKEFTEEDVSEQMKKGSFPPESSDLVEPFDFPGLRSDIEAMERNLFGGLGRFFEAAEEMRNGFFGAFGSPHPYDRDSLSSSSRRRGIPVEEHQSKEASPKLKNPESGHVELKNPESGHVDLSALARDV